MTRCLMAIFIPVIWSLLFVYSWAEEIPQCLLLTEALKTLGISKTLKSAQSPACQSNCFNTALFFFYPDMDRRYVSEEEIQYYLSRDFERVGEVRKSPSGFSTNLLRPLDVLIFDGFVGIGETHAGLFLGKNLILDKRGVGTQYPYRVISINEAYGGMVEEPVSNDPIDRMMAQEREHRRVHSSFSFFYVFRFKGRQVVIKPEEEIPLEALRDIRLAKAYVDLLDKIMGQHPAAPMFLNIVLEETRLGLERRIHQHINRVGIPVHLAEAKLWDNAFGSDCIEVMLRFLSTSDAYNSYKNAVFFPGRSMYQTPLAIRYPHTYWPHADQPTYQEIAKLVWRWFGASERVPDQEGVQRMFEAISRYIDRHRENPRFLSEPPRMDLVNVAQDASE